VRGRGSAWTAAACRRCVGRAGMKLGLPAGRRGGRIPPEPPVFPVQGRLPRCPALWRDAFHGVPWPGWNRALHRIVTTGPGCNPAFQGDAISTGGSRDAWGWSCRRAVAGGETVAQRGGPSGGAPAVQAGSECVTAEGTAGQRGGGGDLRAVSVPVQAHEPVLESGRDEALLCLATLETFWRNERWHLPSRTPAPATCPKTEMRPGKGWVDRDPGFGGGQGKRVRAWEGLRERQRSGGLSRAPAPSRRALAGSACPIPGVRVGIWDGVQEFQAVRIAGGLFRDAGLRACRSAGFQPTGYP